MRRAVVIAGLVAIAVAGAIVVATASSGSGGTYRFAAVFDNARGMVSGQQVKIAGAVVGSVDSVELAPGPKARMVMTIDRRFAPLPADTTCTLLPSGLISENFIQCVPGHATRTLARGAGGLPTVPLARTTVPFSLQDVLDVFSAPTDERLRLLISELGIGTAGRGADINALLRRADPALEQARRVLGILNAQRDRIASAAGQTDAVLTQLAAHDRQVRAFVADAADLTATTAAHAEPLGRALARLPGMLAAVRPGLRSLDTAAANATPLLGELRRATPGLQTLTSVLPSFAAVGTPAVRALAAATRAGRPAVRDATPIALRLNAVTGPLGTLATSLDALLASSRDTGAFEGTLRTIYAFGTNTSLYDNVSHILTFIASVDPGCIAAQQANLPAKGCSHRYTASGGGTIPVNEPSCGPVSAQWWDRTCPIANPGPISTNARSGSADALSLGHLLNSVFQGKSASPSRLRSLLSYLLR
jgi:virulence factor Mce-like protein